MNCSVLKEIRAFQAAMMSACTCTRTSIFVPFHRGLSAEMALPPRLAKEIEQLDLKPEITEDGGVVSLIFRSFPLPHGYNRSTADLLVRVPLSYPDAGPDMFWTPP